MTGRPGPRRMPSGKTERKVTGGKGDTEAKARKNAESAVMDADRITCCNQCKQCPVSVPLRLREPGLRPPRGRRSKCVGRTELYWRTPDLARALKIPHSPGWILNKMPLPAFPSDTANRVSQCTCASLFF